MNGSILSSVETCTVRGDYLSQVRRKGLGLPQKFPHKIIFVNIVILCYNLYLHKIKIVSTHSQSVTSIHQSASSFPFSCHQPLPYHTHWDRSENSSLPCLQYLPFHRRNFPKTIVTALTHLENFDAPALLMGYPNST